MTFYPVMAAVAEECGISLDKKQLEMFSRYYDLYTAWKGEDNPNYNPESREIAINSFLYPLSCYDAAIFPVGCRVIDIGTGGGIPGLPLKILRPDIELYLLDFQSDRLVFLQEVVARLGLSGVTMVHAWAEDIGNQRGHREQYQVALSRGLGSPMKVLVELALPLLSQGGHFIAFKGSRFQEDVAEAAEMMALLGGSAAKAMPVQLPGLENDRINIYIKKTAPTPANYPRPCFCKYASTIEKQRNLVKVFSTFAESLPADAKSNTVMSFLKLQGKQGGKSAAKQQQASCH
ncbi:Ribosomal RNA small subunit methyltransferase G [Sporomusa ovata DSM 2662]|uniref:Ribosomal RNA small subunit methyltransferase G n=1 Tax=Sporomusa ovata TaxID=2378 RepID=A0A0U1KXV0_9FIRM|nr:16S rRNA (guanine(527)-N(7))-methyltransferase RsmG [Sporomusa ovata]EQB28215.1 ribosomal RNA small subunit methyltransferase G [Sporomusa ovata DSM 2662]CQR71753.1 rRNA small subunit 7-methylguanosine (m7G) methyltransferase GidB [Sporomusa ovata]